MNRPHTLTQLRSVLGVFNYHRPFINHYSSIVKPLTDLTSGKKKLTTLPWTKKEQHSFDLIKERLCNAVSLYVPKIWRLFIMRTDASGIAVSAALSQLIDDAYSVTDSGSNEHPVAFCSKVLSVTQTKWSVIEREAYAVVYSLNKFYNIIFSSPIVVCSDHNPLAYIINSATKSSKLARWYLALQEFNITFRYVKAKDNFLADFFSRQISFDAESGGRL
jgi:hypothetical protein